MAFKQENGNLYKKIPVFWRVTWIYININIEMILYTYNLFPIKNLNCMKLKI